MFRKDQFGLVFNTIFSIMFGIFLPLYMDASNMARESGAVMAVPLIQQVIKDFFFAFSLTFVLGTYIDLKGMGDAFARKCGIKDENSLVFHIFRVVCIVFVMTIFMSIIMMFANAGFTMPVGTFFISWLMSFPLTFVVALVVGFVTFAIAMPLTQALCTKPPRIPNHP